MANSFSRKRHQSLYMTASLEGPFLPQTSTPQESQWGLTIQATAMERTVLSPGDLGRERDRGAETEIHVERQKEMTPHILSRRGRN